LTQKKLLFSIELELLSLKLFWCTIAMDFAWFSGSVNREIFAALKVGEFALFQLAIDKIPRLLHKLNGLMH
jgi:hypothetical protein